MTEPGQEETCPVCGNDDPRLIQVDYTTVTFASGAPSQKIPTSKRCLRCEE